MEGSGLLEILYPAVLVGNVDTGCFCGYCHGDMTSFPARLLIALADRLDQEGQFEKADIIDDNFQDFLELLESGEFDFAPWLSGGSRDPRGPYSSRGIGPMPAFGVPGPQ